MNRQIERLINGEDLIKIFSFKEVVYLFKAIRFGIVHPTKEKRLYHPNVVKFMFGCNKEIILFKTPDVDLAIDKMSYKEVKDEINSILTTVTTENITKDIINRYNHLARRNNKIIQVLIDLSGEFHAYQDGILVESVSEV